MEIHFYESLSDIPADKPYYQCWHETENAIRNLEPFIITTQMGLLRTRLTEVGYRIFVHPVEGDWYEIRVGIGEVNTCTDKEIRMAHNLFRMWEAGAFFAKVKPTGGSSL